MKKEAIIDSNFPRMRVGNISTPITTMTGRERPTNSSRVGEGDKIGFLSMPSRVSHT